MHRREHHLALAVENYSKTPRAEALCDSPCFHKLCVFPLLPGYPFRDVHDRLGHNRINLLYVGMRCSIKSVTDTSLILFTNLSFHVLRRISVFLTCCSVGAKCAMRLGYLANQLLKLSEVSLISHLR